MYMVRLRVKEIAEAKGLSVPKLARRADLDNRTVYRIVHDPFAEVTTVTLGRLAKALGVSVKDLVEDAPDPFTEE
jgi:DNA-binding Xre family transcriptional regulator